MTWKEFKEEVEKKGVKDDDKVLYIDFNNSWGSKLVIKTTHGRVTIYSQ